MGDDLVDNATIDGRLARGARRRAEIIEATIRLVEREGVAGVTHRAIASSLGVSPSALTHHFPTLDDLLTAALTSGIIWGDAEFENVSSIDHLAHILWLQMTSERKRLAAVYELYLLAARRPALRDAARGWVISLGRVARRLGADREGEWAMAAAVDGLGLQALLSDEGIDETEVTAVLHRAIGPAS